MQLTQIGDEPKKKPPGEAGGRQISPKDQYGSSAAVNWPDAFSAPSV